MAYRDKDGNEIDVSEHDIQLTFAGLDVSSFNTSISVCSYFDESHSVWRNESCSSLFFEGKAVCSCPHLSFYSIIEDYGRRPAKIDPVILAISDWPALVVFLYILAVIVFAVVYVIIRD